MLLFEDDDVIVLSKPAGVLSVPGRGDDKQDCVLSRLHAQGHNALVVHRLDTATSGLMVFAKHLAAQRSLSHAFATRQTHKTYEAIVQGDPSPNLTDLTDLTDQAPERATHHTSDRASDDTSDHTPDRRPDRRPPHKRAIDIDIHSNSNIDSDCTPPWHRISGALIIDWPNRPRSKVCEHTGKPALTLWQRMDHAPAGQTRLRLRPITGRTHQLRVHLMHMGHPIMGDALYHPSFHHLTNEGEQAPARLLLHATHLSFAGLRDGALQTWHCPAPF